MTLNQEILVWINQGWAHPWADRLFVWVSGRETFALPLLIILLGLLAWRHRGDGIRLWMVMMLMMLLGDAAGNLLKHLLGQYRPCYDFFQSLRPVPGTGWPCGSKASGMPSNHALNFFAVVSFLAMTTRRRLLVAALAGAAVLAALSRLYLGKHYPAQVLAGILLGIAWGTAAGWLGRHYLHFVQRVRQGQAACG